MTKYDFKDENGIRYYVRKNPKGYAYEIMKVKDGKYTCVYFSGDKDYLLYEFEGLRAHKGDRETFKFPESTVEPNHLKVVIVEGKHHTYHISAPTLEMYYKSLRYYLRQEYGTRVDNWKPQHEPVNESGITCKEDLDKIPFDDVRLGVLSKWNKYQKELKDFNSEIREWENLRDVIHTEGGNVEEAMSYMGDSHELIELETVE